MRVFLTGGMGYVGTRIREELLARGHEVRCLVRPRSRRLPAPHQGVEAVLGNITDPATLQGKIQGCDAVIHLVGIIKEIPLAGVTFERIHFQGTKHVVDAARAQGVRRFIHMSSLGTRPNARARYHRTKYLAEEYLKQSGLDFTIFRPSVIFGPGDAFVNLFAGMIRRPFPVPVIGTGRSKLQPVALENIARGFAGAVVTPATVGKTYEAGGAEAFDLIQILDIIGEVLGKPRVPKVSIPLALMRPLVALMQWIPPFPLSLDQLTMLQEDNVCDEKPFYRDLGLVPLPFREGITRYLRR